MLSQNLEWLTHLVPLKIRTFSEFLGICFRRRERNQVKGWILPRCTIRAVLVAIKAKLATSALTVVGTLSVRDAVPAGPNLRDIVLGEGFGLPVDLWHIYTAPSSLRTKATHLHEIAKRYQNRA